MTDRGVPPPGPALIAGSVFQVMAGLAVVIGWLIRFAAAPLIGFTLVSSFMLMNSGTWTAKNEWHN